jgi:hypothetical protein
MRWQHGSLTTCVVLVVVSVMLMKDSPLAYAQSVPPYGPEVEPGRESSIRSAHESATTIVPSLRLAERYDSNVYFVQGGNLEDYVTTVAPGLRVGHKNSWIEGMAVGGATGEVYVKNPGLNYVGANGTIDLNLDDTVNRLLRGMHLRVTDDINYTPQPLAFAAPTGGSQLSEAFVQGIQARRANSFTNVGKVEASYFFSPHVGVTSSYTDSRRRFGKAVSTPDGIVQRDFIDTDFQTVSSGFIGRPTEHDTISLLHQYRKATFVDPDRGERGFSTQGAIVKWSKSITPSLNVTGEGGFSVLNGSSNVYTMGGASVEWRAQYTTVQISYSRSISPSFLFISTPLLSQVVVGSAKRQMTDSLSLSMSGSYALNHSIPDSSLLRFNSYSVTPSLEYRISRYLTATLSYTRSEFQRTLLKQSVDFDRNMTMFLLSAEWR